MSVVRGLDKDLGKIIRVMDFIFKIYHQKPFHFTFLILTPQKNTIGVLQSFFYHDIAAKQAAKYDPEREAAVKKYIEQVTGEKFPNTTFAAALKDGVVLCK